MKMRSRSVNNGTELLPYLVSSRHRMAIDELMAQLNPTTGPITRVVSYFAADGQLHVSSGHSEQFDLNHVLARLLAMPSLDTGVGTNVHGGGKGFLLSDMFLSSLGEGVERVVGSLCHLSGSADHRLTTSRELKREGVRHLTPDHISLFAPEQRDMYAPSGLYQRFTEDTPVAWVTGKSLLDGDSVLVPAQLVDFWYVFTRGEHAIGYSQSGGLSCHVSMQDAIYHATTEVIERDAVNLRWYAGIPPIRVELDGGFEDNKECARLVEDLGRWPVPTQIYYHNVDLHEVPVFTAIRVEPYFNEFSYYAGGGADLCPYRLLTKTLGEFGQSERMLRMGMLAPDKPLGSNLRRMFSVRPDAELDEFDLFYKVVGYYGHVRNREKLDWYLNGQQSVKFSELCERAGADVLKRSVGEKLERLLQVLARDGIEPIAFDLTPPQWRELKLVKVFIPQLCAPFLPSLPLLGHPRFRIARRLAGLSNEELSFEQLTKDPLPYP